MNTNKKLKQNVSNLSSPKGTTKDGIKSLISIVEAMSRDIAIQRSRNDYRSRKGSRKRNNNKKLKRPTNSAIYIPPSSFVLDYSRTGGVRFFFCLKYRPFTDRKWFKKKLLVNVGKKYHTSFLYHYFSRLSNKISLHSITFLNDNEKFNKSNVLFFKLNRIIRTNIHNNMAYTVEYSTLRNLNNLYSLFNFSIFSRKSISNRSSRLLLDTSIKQLLSNFYTLVRTYNSNSIENQYILGTRQMWNQSLGISNAFSSITQVKKTLFNNNILRHLKKKIYDVRILDNINHMNNNISYFYIYTLFYKVFKAEKIISNICYPLFWRTEKPRKQSVGQSTKFITFDLIRHLSFLPNYNKVSLLSQKKDTIRSNLFYYMDANDLDKKDNTKLKNLFSSDDIEFITSVHRSIRSKRSLDDKNLSYNFSRSLRLYTKIFGYMSTMSFKFGGSNSKEILTYIHRINIVNSVKKLYRLAFELRDGSIEIKLFKETRNKRIRSYLDKLSLYLDILEDLSLFKKRTSMNTNLVYLMATLSILKKYIHYNLLKNKKRKKFLFFRFRKIKRKIKWKKMHGQHFDNNTVLNIYGKKKNLKRKLKTKKKKLIWKK